MFDKKTDAMEAGSTDLRHGMRGSLTVPVPPLVGADPLYALHDPRLASPDLTTPPGQVTHS